MEVIGRRAHRPDGPRWQRAGQRQRFKHPALSPPWPIRIRAQKGSWHVFSRLQSETPKAAVPVVVYLIEAGNSPSLLPARSPSHLPVEAASRRLRAAVRVAAAARSDALDDPAMARSSLAGHRAQPEAARSGGRGTPARARSPEALRPEQSGAPDNRALARCPEVVPRVQLDGRDSPARAKCWAVARPEQSGERDNPVKAKFAEVDLRGRSDESLLDLRAWDRRRPLRRYRSLRR
jgi:hypothetical protein